eukprot:NODE_3_length_80033_cov_0.932970.p45 type:complete len:224 gc:universal NODE_3_length_80033_cov_0.932970:45325-44654(-)
MHCVFHSNILAKYTCPACSAKSCSLNCVVKHKAEEKCDGNRKLKIQFIKKSEWKSKSHNDRKFLENISSSLKEKKQSINLRRRKRPIGKIREICEKFNITWKVAPLGLEVSMQNLTHVKKSSLFWTIKINLNDKDLLIHDIDGLCSVAFFLTEKLKLKSQDSQVLLFYVYQHVTNNVQHLKRWINVPEARWEDSIFHALTYGILPGESIVIHEYPSFRIKTIG